ncbi:L-ectoine synthase [Clostridia bacterium]|nr:L-ectoine synthase [Clostridia bacterium]
MIIREREDLKGSAQFAETDIWTSARFFTKDDALGFSLHETRVKAGTEQTLWYKNHAEAVVITEGEAEIVDLATGEAYHLGPGSAYALTGDRHIFRTFTDVVCYCVFLPGLSGDEVPDEDGVYPESGEA